MKHLVLGISLVITLVVGCQQNTPAQSASNQLVQNGKILKIKVTASGGITADGQPTTVEQLGGKLPSLKQAGGEVWYHRENPSGEPHPNAMKVISLVAESKLPIKLSAKPDFSDAVDDKGVSHPGGR